MNHVLAGMSVALFMTTGLFFLRFWKQTGDRLFAIFALAFWVMAVNRLVMTLFVGEMAEVRTYLYIVRLLAFLLILWAILDKNYLQRSSRR